MVIIKDGRSSADNWQHLDDHEPIPASGAITVSKTRWQAERSELIAREGPVGLRLEASDTPDEIAADVHRFPLIALDFATLTDGRLFSLARLLRERLRFSGELRATGDFIQDQMFFLRRVGVDSFESAAAATAQDVAAALATFSVSYQAAADEPRPLYQRTLRRQRPR